MNTENLVSIHLPVQYWIRLYGKNNYISYRNAMIIENLMFISSLLGRIIWQKNNNIPYRNIMNTENLVYNHLPVQYWIGVCGKSYIS
jgi:hypothetical protein